LTGPTRYDEQIRLSCKNHKIPGLRLAMISKPQMADSPDT